MKHGFCKTARTIFFAILLTFLTFTAANAQNMLINGDAETDSIDFITQNLGTITRVEDPHDPTGVNHCWYSSHKQGTGKAWTYFCQDGIAFEPGQTYEVEMDVALAKDTAGNDVNAYTGLTLNMKYIPVGAASLVNHTFALDTALSTSDGWVHISKRITIGDDFDTEKPGVFSVFAAPKDDLAVCYYIDNVSLTKTNLILPDVISDNMMIQKDKPFKIWGSTTVPGDVTVTLLCNGAQVQTKTVTAVNGDFEAEFEPRNSGGGYTLIISNDRETKTVNNVIFGELWLLSGQSNMYLPIEKCGNASNTSHIDEMLPKTTLSDVRFFTSDDYGKGRWVIPDPTSSVRLSAVGLTAVSKLYESLNEPVGGLSTAYPGKSMQEFTKGAKIYNLRMQPFENVNFRAVMWYQGENNISTSDVANFGKLFDTMRNSWETVWGKLPFIYVQLPQSPATFPNFSQNLDKDGNPTTTATKDYTGVRLMQAKYYIENRDTQELGMVVTFDTKTHIFPLKSAEDKTAEDPLHSWNKKPIGERLANYALAMLYGKTDIPYLSPEIDYAYLNADGNTVVKYKNVGNSLITTDGDAPKFFEVKDKNGVYHKADSMLIGKDRVLLQTSDITDITGVAYAYETHFVDMNAEFVGMKVNLVSENGLPAMPQETEVLTEAPDPSEKDITEFMPVSLDKYSVRTNSPSGLRFHSFVTDVQKNACDEYGYIVSTENILGDTALTFDCGKTYVSAPAYIKGTDTDIIYALEDGGAKTVFTGVATNIPVSAYRQTLIVRPYVKLKDQNGVSYTLYGVKRSATLYDTAKSVLASAEELTDGQAAFLKQIILDYDKYYSKLHEVVVDIGNLYDE